jgi:hypothetical protein
MLAIKLLAMFSIAYNNVMKHLECFKLNREKLI